MEKLNITKGKYTFDKQKGNFCAQVWFPSGIDCLTVNHIPNWEIADSIAKLSEDALNTYQDCNILPSELLRQRDELLKSVSQVISYLESCKEHWEEGESILYHDLINSIENE